MIHISIRDLKMKEVMSVGLSWLGLIKNLQMTPGRTWARLNVSRELHQQLPPLFSQVRPELQSSRSLLPSPLEHRILDKLVKHATSELKPQSFGFLRHWLNIKQRLAFNWLCSSGLIYKYISIESTCVSLLTVGIAEENYNSWCPHTHPQGPLSPSLPPHSTYT